MILYVPESLRTSKRCQEHSSCLDLSFSLNYVVKFGPSGWHNDELRDTVQKTRYLIARELGLRAGSGRGLHYQAVNRRRKNAGWRIQRRVSTYLRGGTFVYCGRYFAFRHTEHTFQLDTDCVGTSGDTIQRSTSFQSQHAGQRD